MGALMFVVVTFAAAVFSKNVAQTILVRSRHSGASCPPLVRRVVRVAAPGGILMGCVALQCLSDQFLQWLLVDAAGCAVGVGAVGIAVMLAHLLEVPIVSATGGKVGPTSGLNGKSGH